MEVRTPSNSENILIMPIMSCSFRDATRINRSLNTVVRCCQRDCFSSTRAIVDQWIREHGRLIDKLEIPPLITEDTPADFEELTVIVFESEALCHNMLQRLETNTKNMCETKEILKETSEQISNMKTSSNVTNQKENSNRRYAAKTTGKQILRN
ncbi:hypothetical protein Zmor_001352 [Zophobas morio]|uniref:Uncharacterized protein n=1 Tax=Zophobas morio TaxID=2755281 RepID=A0AA38MSJ7_9CUCU|nr:hypothetical protein Zmor_001352 [Zophobas morio]